MWWTEPESTTDHKHFTNKTEMRFWVVHINMECQNTSQRTRPLNSSHHHFWEYVWDTSKHHLWQCKFSSLNLTMCLLAVWTKYVNLSHHAFRVWQKKEKTVETQCGIYLFYCPALEHRLLKNIKYSTVLLFPSLWDREAIGFLALAAPPPFLSSWG